MGLRLRTMQVHCCAVRLCALVYFFAFLGNVVDGPIMWKLEAPAGYTSGVLVRLNEIALIPAVLVFLRPWCWPALCFCWKIWHDTTRAGGFWFFFGWDQMMDEIGFLSCLLSVTLTLYDHDGQAEDNQQSSTSSSGSSGAAEHLTPGQQEEHEPVLQAEKAQNSPALRSRRPASERAGRAEEAMKRGATDLTEDVMALSVWQLLWHPLDPKPEGLERCHAVVDWARSMAEISLSLASFRLFFAAGLIKMRAGSPCWKDLTCLYDHYETQPMPNSAAWYFHNYTPRPFLRIMQWFAIDVSECIVPFLLLGFAVSMGPLGVLRRELLRGDEWYLQWLACFPARLVGSVTIMTFVFGMFVGGNYAFLHPLSLVALVASMGIVEGVPMQKKSVSPEKAVYRLVMPWLTLLLLLFAFLPSLRAFAWLSMGNERLGILEPLAQSGFVRAAGQMNLGIAYNHHAYFAGAVHTRNEMVLFADAGEGLIELDIPYKVGRPDRAPRQTSPLHRRFAWQWWFLALGSDPSWLMSFMELLCHRDRVAWEAVEWNDKVHANLSKLQKVSVQMYTYHFSKPGSSDWWSRELLRGHGLEISCV
ncbi:LMF1 [Symbiodinium sp. CCMP2456]|nr:LMF1 [Symbiodinium sp. CCMP2456]